jgi:hypothetical protein
MSGPPQEPDRPPAVAHLRAALLFLALLGNAIYALPLPSAVSRTEVEKEGFQSDIDLWEGWLGAAGIPVTHDDLEAFVVSATARLGSLHKTLKKPFAPLFRLVGANQAWALFASATTKPDRLVVEIERAPGSGWVPIERRLDPCCTWRDAQLRYRRIRGVWDGQQDAMRPGYKGLTKWIAREALLDHPDALRVRVWLEQTESVYPWETPEDGFRVRHERVHRRDAIFGETP